MFTRTTVNRREVVCTNVREIVEAYPLPPTVAHNAHLAPECTHKGTSYAGKEWYGDAKDQSDCDAAVSSGWHKGADKVSRFAEELAVNAPPAVDVRRKRRRMDDGDDLCIDSAMRGEWDTAWETFRRAETNGNPIVELVFNWGMSCGVTGEQMFWQGAVACALTDILEGAGYRVGLTAVQAIHHRIGTNAHAATVIRVKDVGDSMCLSDLAAFTAHSGVYRTYGFKMILEHSAEVNRNFGYPEYDDADMRGDVAESGYISDRAVWIPSVYDRASAIRTVREMLETLAK